MAEKQEDHRIEIESKVIESNIRNEKLGVISGLVIGLAGLSCATICALYGHDWVAGIIGGDTARVILLDPPDPMAGSGTGNIRTNLTADLVKRAAKGMRTQTQTLETVFRSPTAELALKREEYKGDKGHGWLEISS